MNNKELIESILKGVADDLVSDQAAKKLRASGQSAASFKTVANESEGSLKASPYIHFQIHGRRPGPFKNGVKTMLKWIEDKGIQPKDPKTPLKSLAFLFARKISQRGNDIYLGKKKGLDTQGIYAKWKEILLERFKENLKKELNGVITSK